MQLFAVPVDDGVVSFIRGKDNRFSVHVDISYRFDLSPDDVKQLVTFLTKPEEVKP